MGDRALFQGMEEEATDMLGRPLSMNLENTITLQTTVGNKAVSYPMNFMCLLELTSMSISIS